MASSSKQLNDQNIQTNEDNNEFPPLSSAAQLHRERGTEKGKHTKLANKIKRYMDEGRSAQVVAELRIQLVEQYDLCADAHRRYIAARDYVPAPEDVIYLRDVEELTRPTGLDVETYIQAPRTQRAGRPTGRQSRTRSGPTMPGPATSPSHEANFSSGEEGTNDPPDELQATTKPADDGSGDSTDKINQLQDLIRQLARKLDEERASREKAEASLRAFMEDERKARQLEQVTFAKQVGRALQGKGDRNVAFELDAPQRGRYTARTKNTGAIPKERRVEPTHSSDEEDDLYGARSHITTIQSDKSLKSLRRSWTADDVTYPTAMKAERNAKTITPDTSPKGWQFSRGADSPTPGNSHARRSIFRTPKIDLHPFNGNPKDWPHFISSYTDLVESDRSLTAAEKMALLRSCLTVELRECLGDSLNNPNQYEEALTELESTYGHPHVISRTYLRRIIHLPTVNSTKDCESLLRFSTTLRGALATLKSGGYEGGLEGILEIVLDKLPEDIQEKWGEKIIDVYPDILTLYDFEAWLHKRVKAKMVVKHGKMAASVPVKLDKKQGRPTQNHGNRQPPPTVLATASSPGPIGTPLGKPEEAAKRPDRTPSAPKVMKCLLCGNNHRLAECPEFASKSVTDRVDLVRSFGACIRCLCRGHGIKHCLSKRTCAVDKCTNRYHPLLHGGPSLYPKEPAASAAVGTAAVGSTQLPVLLAVVLVTLSNKTKSINTFALLDNGSEVTLVKEAAAKAIGLTGPVQRIRLGTFHGRDPEIETRRVSCTIAPRNSPKAFQIANAITVQRLNVSPRRCNWPSVKGQWKHLADIQLPAIDASQVTVLIGRDLVGAHDILECRRPEEGTLGPEAILTPFGWCAVGPVPPSVLQSAAPSLTINHVHLPDLSTERLDDLVAQFWKTESFGVAPPSNKQIPPEEKRGLSILESTIRHNGSRYEAVLMWKEENVQLPDNREAALRQFLALERRFRRDPSYAEKYDKVVQEYISLGHAKRVDDDDTGTPGRVQYLRHHGVTSPSKPGKVRVVFNCSARHNGISLNDTLLKGPDLLTSLVRVLLRFRQRPIPVIGDVEKMYHQVMVKQEDRSALRFLYRPPGSTEKVATYEMQVHVFGAISSPTTCIYAFRRTATDQLDKYPEVADLAIENTYVDNLLYSAETEDEAISKARQFKEMCKHGGFNVVQWMSTSRRFLEKIDPAELAKPIRNVTSDQLPIERTLGILLDCQTDEFTFKIEPRSVSSMREILQFVSSIHDPLGFICPAVLPGRTLMQISWQVSGF